MLRDSVVVDIKERLPAARFARYPLCMVQTSESSVRARSRAMLAALALAFAGSLAATGQSPPRAAKPPGSQPATQPGSQPSTQPAIERLVIGGEAFELEVAATPEARELGLMHREHIDDHGGMLFIYPWSQVLSYWMKNCPIEMDILFINDKSVIVATHRMQPAPPRRPGQTEEAYDNSLPRYESRRPAQFAIELKAGTIQRLKIRPGDMLEMDVKRLAGMASEHQGR